MRFLKLALCLSVSGAALSVAPAAAQTAEPVATTEGGSPAQGDVTTSDIVVTGIRGSIQNAQNIKRDAPSVVEAIAPQDLGRFSDPSIADAFQRVPGVQIQRSENGTSGERASIRGLGPAFVRVTVNGRTPLSYGSEGITSLRSFNLDSIPSEVIAGALIYKTPTADLIETGLAGGLELKTLRPLDYTPGSGSGVLSPNVFGTMTASIRRDNVNNDWGPRVSGVLGAKLLDETLGVYVAGVWTDADNRVEALASSPVYTNVQVRNAAGGVDTVNNILFPAFNGNTLLGKTKRLAISTGLQWKPSDQFELNLDYDYDRYDRPSLRLTHRMDLGGANGSLRSSIFEPGSITIENGTITFIDFSKVTPPSNGGNPNNVATGFDTRSFLYNNYSETQMFGANAAFKGDRITLKVDGSASKLNARQQLFAMGGGVYWFPTNTGTVYSNPDGRNPSVTIPQSANIFNPNNYVLGAITTRIFQNKANNQALRLDGDWEPIDDLHLQFGSRWSNQIVDVRAGNRGRALSASEQAAAVQQLWTGQIEHNGTSDVLGIGSFPVRNILALAAAQPQVILPDTPNAVPFVGPFANSNDPTATLPLDVNNSYRVRERTLAFYAQASGEGTLGNLRFSGNAGVRAVRTDNIAMAFQGVRLIDQATNRQLSTATSLVTNENSYWRFLPSANLSLYPSEKLTARFGVSRTMSRPEFEQLSPINAITLSDPTQPLYNPSINDTARIGNTNLRPTMSWNYDMTLEYYPSFGGAYYLSGFYKDVKDFIFTGVLRNQTLPGQGSRLFDVTTATNASNGQAVGFEIGMNQPFTFLPGALKNFGMQANFTYVDSKFDTNNVLLQYGFPGASKYNANAVLYYDDSRFQARLSYVYRGNYLALLGNGQDRNQLPTFTRAIGTLDATTSYKVTDNAEIILTVSNITKADRYDYIYTTSTFREHDIRPRSFTLAGRVTF